MNPILYAFLSDNFKKSFMKAFTCAKTKEINAQLHAENSFFPRFGRNRNSECLSKPTTTNLIVNINSQAASKLTQTHTKLGNTVESILDATENGHTTTAATTVITTNGHQLNNVNKRNCHVAGDVNSDDEQVNKINVNHMDDDSVCIINPLNGSNKTQPVLHTDL
jgi:hypothetical protein